MQRALTIKILAIGLLALIMLIPLSMIQSKISERDYYRQEAVNSVANSWTGNQTLVTPFVVIPYSYTDTQTLTTSSGTTSTEQLITRYRFVPADRVSIAGRVATSTLMKGVYKIPVYESDLQISGRFSHAALEKVMAEIDAFEPAQEDIAPFLVIHISDPRGISNTPLLNWNDQAIKFEPGANQPMLPDGIHALLPAFSSNPEQDIEFNLSLALRGMEKLSVVPVGDQVDIELTSPWQHPEFIGAFLPENRDISDQGFSASWRVTQFANNIGEKLRRCERGDCSAVGNSSLGVNLIDPVDVYLQSERSVKYGILFIGLSFISFFLFENLKKMRIHPIQYGLVGFSIATFYLLLISLSEHIHFGLSYALATLACVTLIFAYLKSVLAGIKNSLWFCAALTTLYAILYIIIQAEDFALLMGAVLVFAMLAILMLVTRRIDWYQVGEQMTQRDLESPNQNSNQSPNPD